MRSWFWKSGAVPVPEEFGDQSGCGSQQRHSGQALLADGVGGHLADRQVPGDRHVRESAPMGVTSRMPGSPLLRKPHCEDGPGQIRTARSASSCARFVKASTLKVPMLARARVMDMLLAA